MFKKIKSQFYCTTYHFIIVKADTPVQSSARSNSLNHKSNKLSNMTHIYFLMKIHSESLSVSLRVLHNKNAQARTLMFQTFMC